MSAWVGQPERNPRPLLTAVQQQSLEAIADGLTQVQEAARYGPGYTQEAIQDRRRQVREKLGAANSAHAVALGYRQGLLR